MAAILHSIISLAIMPIEMVLTYGILFLMTPMGFITGVAVSMILGYVAVKNVINDLKMVLRYIKSNTPEFTSLVPLKKKSLNNIFEKQHVREVLSTANIAVNNAKVNNV